MKKKMMMTLMEMMIIFFEEFGEFACEVRARSPSPMAHQPNTPPPPPTTPPPRAVSGELKQ